MVKEIEDVEALEMWTRFVTNRLHGEKIIEDEDRSDLHEFLDEAFTD